MIMAGLRFKYMGRLPIEIAKKIHAYLWKDVTDDLHCNVQERIGLSELPLNWRLSSQDCLTFSSKKLWHHCMNKRIYPEENDIRVHLLYGKNKNASFQAQTPKRELNETDYLEALVLKKRRLLYI
jgi:hypothetical protein